MINNYDIQKPFGEKVPFHPNNLVRKQRKSSRSPINPIDLENFKSSLTPHDTGSDICASHSGVTPASARKCLDKDNQRKPSTAKTRNENGTQMRDRQSPNSRSKSSLSGRCNSLNSENIFQKYFSYFILGTKLTSAWRLEVTKQKRLKKLVFWLFELGLQMDGIRSAWGGGCWGDRMFYLR